MGVHEQIIEARRNVRGMAKAVPHIFPEWQRLQQAEDRLKEAKAERLAALNAWNRIKKGQP